MWRTSGSTATIVEEQRRPEISARFAAIALTAFVVNALTIPVILAIAHRFDWYDEHNSRKIHTSDTPRLGGLGIFVSFLVAAVLGLIMMGVPDAPGGLGYRSVLLLGAGLLVMHGLGLYDDFVNLRAPLKFLVQLISGTFVAISGASFGAIELPWVGVLTLPIWLSVPATAFWVVAIANAVNLIDGADGLAGGIGLIIALFIGLIAIGQGSLLAALFASALVGSLAGFLVYNMPPARIFMGDGGSLALGYLLATLPLVGLQRGHGPVATIPPVAIVPVITLFYIPIVDTLLAIVRRVGRGLPIHAADREHIHHRLIDRGVHGHRLLLVIYGAAIALGFVAASWYSIPKGTSAIIAFAVWAIALGAILAIGKWHSRDERSL